MGYNDVKSRCLLLSTLVKQEQKTQNFILFLKIYFFIFYKMEAINKIQNNEVKKEDTQKAKNQSVEGSKIYKTRKYVQTDTARKNAEARRLRDKYLIDHKEEILKLKHKGRVKKVAELLKQDLNLDVNYRTLGNLIQKYVISGISNQNAEARKKRDQYLKDHKEEILKLKHNQRIKKANELLKKDLNLNVNYNTLYSALKKCGIL